MNGVVCRENFISRISSHLLDAKYKQTKYENAELVVVVELIAKKCALSIPLAAAAGLSSVISIHAIQTASFIRTLIWVVDCHTLWCSSYILAHLHYLFTCGSS